MFMPQSEKKYIYYLLELLFQGFLVHLPLCKPEKQCVFCMIAFLQKQHDAILILY